MLAFTTLWGQLFGLCPARPGLRQALLTLSSASWSSCRDSWQISELPWPLLCCILLTLKERLGEGLLLSCTVTFGQVRFTCIAGGAVLESAAV